MLISCLLDEWSNVLMVKMLVQRKGQISCAHAYVRPPLALEHAGVVNPFKSVLS